MPATGMILLVTLLHLLGFSAQHDFAIVNGREAVPHSKPYMVSLQVTDSHVCGGFLVSTSFMMTAAHCFTGEHKLIAMLGAHDVTKKENTVRIPVKFYHIYPGFDKKTLENDIMLLQLEKAVELTETVQLISIPKKDQEVKPGSLCNVAGWGLSEDGGHSQPCLMEANVTTLSYKACRDAWKNISKRMLCAGGNKDKKGICKGDSGGPLVCKIKGKKRAVGIVSFHQKDKCDSPTKPNVYIQVSKYLLWIKCIINSIEQKGAYEQGGAYRRCNEGGVLIPCNAERASSDSQWSAVYVLDNSRFLVSLCPIPASQLFSVLHVHRTRVLCNVQAENRKTIKELGITE